jgi:twinfilin
LPAPHTVFNTCPSFNSTNSPPASAELRTAFRQLLSNPSHRGLLATIKNERIEPLEHIPSSSASFLSDLSNLTPHINPTTALYILLRRADDLSSAGSGSCVAVTYVPNAAPVRSKTLFAATRLTLVRELGGEHFADSLFVTEPAELTDKGWRAHEAHEEAGQPLTREEQDLEGIKEAEARERGGTGNRRGHVDSGFAVNVAEGVVEALGALKAGSGANLVQLVGSFFLSVVLSIIFFTGSLLAKGLFEELLTLLSFLRLQKFDVPTETLTLDSETTTDAASLSSAISATDPRYSFYRHGAAGILFVYTCPTASRIKDRMLYASSRQSVLNIASSAGLEVTKKIEATDPSDISSDAVEDEFKEQPVAEQASSRSAFAKPKRPGRG